MGIISLLEEEKDRELYETYVAQCLWEQTRAVYGIGGAELTMPQYVEIIHPETKKKQQTAQEIKDHVLARLLEV